MSSDQKYIQKSTQEYITAGPVSGGFRSRDTDAQSLECDPQSRRRQWRRCIPHPALPGTDSADSGSLPQLKLDECRKGTKRKLRRIGSFIHHAHTNDKNAETELQQHDMQVRIIHTVPSPSEQEENVGGIRREIGTRPKERPS
ncbi:hypothetical protein Tsp_06248 [Trichinella spiralis]|uniref:hypothetical protein n=1 Tax=Trichinella spiralis TaxID=6334 RepID=UPI0001EFB90E|nr:hypothetical protein Tsp_06248 [Trichinella spiralis]